MDEVVVIPGRSGSQPSRQLGSKYFLGRPLGRGAMGVVHDATNRENEPLAVKILRPELSTDDRTVARFVQERQIFNRLNHPNVVLVHDLVAEGDQLGIVMEKVNGGDLKDRIAARSLTPTRSMQIATEIAAGLEAIHGVDVVHRDLKPANILLAELPDGSLQPKISDFGISRLVSEAMTRTSTTIGTPLYMAPEAADKRGADAPADIYSLGAVMFEMLIGSAPFHEGGTFAVLKAHAVERPPAVGGVPEQLTDLIDDMLAKDPAARPIATAVRQRLLSILPQIDDSHSPIAIARPSSEDTLQANWAAAAAADGVDVSGDSAATSVDGSGSDSSAGGAAAAGGVAAGGVAMNGAAFAAVPDISNAETSIEPIVPGGGDPSDSSETVIMGAQGTGAAPATTTGAASAPAEMSAESPAMPAPGDSSETVIDPAELPVAAAAAGLTAGPDAAVPAAVPGPGESPPSGFVLDRSDPSQNPGAPPAPPIPPTTTGKSGGLLPDHGPKRLIGIGIAAASIAALGAITFFALSGDGGDERAEEGDNNQIEAGDDRSGDEDNGVGSDGGGTADGESGGQGRFASTVTGGQDGESGGNSTGSGSTVTTSKSSNGSATTEAGDTTTTTEGATTTTDGGPSTTEITTPTTQPTTPTTERETTTTERETTTSQPTTTAPAAVPIRIVSGPTVNVVTSSSFQFNYTTNDVCGTGSFTVVKASDGTFIGSNTGRDVCFGPLHGGFPQASHPTFGGYIMEPNTTYRVTVTVRGTASDGTRQAGSGSDSRSFNVTTSP